jgi:hypothetical protein
MDVSSKQKAGSMVLNLLEPRSVCRDPEIVGRITAVIAEA